jgi:hypothetical protein
MTIKKQVRDLNIGDRVVCNDNKPHEITTTIPFGRGQKLIGIDNTIDGAYKDDVTVEVEVE